MINRKGFLFLLFSLSNILVFGQNALMPKLDTLAGNFIKSITVNEKEKVLVQTNKWYYYAGEDIWLRAYCLSALPHKALRQSKTLFVDVVSEKDSVVSRILLNNGLLKLDGRISLPTDLPEGYYWLRAYTRRQLKQDPLNIYVQPLYIFNSSKKDTHAIAHEGEDFREDSMTEPGASPANTEHPIIRFYPEGGSFIAGSSTKFAFTAFDQQGKPLELFGYVTDSANRVLVKYVTSMPGLGSFNLAADALMKYTAHTIYGPGSVLVTALPLPDTYGYQLSVISQSDDSVFIQVSLGDSVYKKYKPSYVMGVSRDSLCFAATGEDMYTFSIAKQKFPEGKASLLLFDEEQRIVSQRDLYISKAGPGLTIVPDRTIYGPRQKVKLSISTSKAEDEQTPTAVLSIAVTDDRTVNESEEPSTLVRFKSDNIEFPNKDSKASDIYTYSSDVWDLVMLAQPGHYLGWLKSRDNNLIPQPLEQSDSEVTSLRGRVLSKKNLPVKDRIITLLSTNGEGVLETDTTDDKGRFHFRLPDNIWDSTKLCFNVDNLKGWQMQDSVVMDPTAFPLFSTPVILKKRFSQLQIRQLEAIKHSDLDSFAFGKRNGWLTLPSVTVAKAKKTPVTYDESKIVSSFSRIIPGDKIGLNPNSIEIALLSTAGVSFGGYGLQIHGGGIGNSEPLVYVDGFQVHLDPTCRGCDPVLEYLKTLNTRTIDFIEVMEGADATVYGPGSDGGIIYIHTANGFRADPEDEKKGLKVFYARGYHTARPFQEPDYDKQEIKNSPYPDQRSTIYWNGNIISDNRGKAILQFFTADSPVNYNVLVIGLTSGGEILSGNTKIMVHHLN